MTIWTPYPDIDDLLTDLLGRMQLVLGDRIMGLYLYGSLVTGDFDHAISDIDLLAVVSSDLAEPDLEALHAMHDTVAADHPPWCGRIEVAYVPALALKTFRTQVSTIAVISPGEPFHTKAAGHEWLMNWWMVREQGLTLHGPPPSAFIDSISREEFLQNVREHTGLWIPWLEDERTLPPQSYVIITACRAMYVVRHGEQTAKRHAARWAQARYPQWAALIDDALAWRAGAGWDEIDPEAAYPETLRFARFAIAQIMAGD